MLYANSAGTTGNNLSVFGNVARTSVTVAVETLVAVFFHIFNQRDVIYVFHLVGTESSYFLLRGALVGRALIVLNHFTSYGSVAVSISLALKKEDRRLR